MVDVVVRKLIQERLDELGLNYSEVSKRLGHSHAYIQQFLKRGSPKELRERERYMLAEILQVPETELRGTSASLPAKNYARNVATPQLSVDQGSTGGLTKVGAGPQGTPVAEQIFGAFDLPLFGIVHGTGGELIVSDHAVAWVARPFFLMRVEGAYALMISTNAMAPAIRRGAQALVHPHPPPRVGDLCVFRSHSEESPDKILIKEYLGETDSVWKARRYNPDCRVILKKSEWQTCHRIVGTYFP
jgi:hypothetical protein